MFTHSSPQPGVFPGRTWGVSWSTRVVSWRQPGVFSRQRVFPDNKVFPGNLVCFRAGVQNDVLAEGSSKSTQNPAGRIVFEQKIIQRESFLDDNLAVRAAFRRHSCSESGFSSKILQQERLFDDNPAAGAAF